MAIKMKFSDEFKEKFYPGGLEGWKKNREIINDSIFRRIKEEERQKRQKKYQKRMQELKDAGFTMEKIDRFEEDE